MRRNLQNGTVWVNYRMQVKGPCTLDLRTFPFDTQQVHSAPALCMTCQSFDVLSVPAHLRVLLVQLGGGLGRFLACDERGRGRVVVKVSLVWFPQPVTLMKKIQLPDFNLIGWKAENLTLPYPNGMWDELSVSFVFKRRYGFYVLQVHPFPALTLRLGQELLGYLCIACRARRVTETGSFKKTKSFSSLVSVRFAGGENIACLNHLNLDFIPRPTFRRT